MDSKRIELRILGPTDLIGTVSESGSNLVRQPKRLALLAYLALETATGFRRRDEVIGLFWPELDQTQGRTYLRKALHAIRASLGENVILARGDDEVRLDRSVLWCDAVALREHEEAAQYREALDLYRGELLAGLFPDGVAQEFEEWLRHERKDLRRAAARSAWECVRIEEERGATAAATTTARRALEIEPDNEEGVRRLILLLDKRGDRGGALRVYAEWQAHLKTEYGVEPAPETRRVARNVQAARKGESHETPPSLPAIGQKSFATGPLTSSRTPEGKAASPVSGRVRSETRSRLPWLALGLLVVAAIAASAGLFIAGNGKENGRSVAVLPFRPIGDPALQSSADAIAEEIITALAMDTTLVVRPSIGASNEARGDSDLGDRRMSSAYVLHGAVQKSSTTIRVTLRLVRTIDGTAIWAGSDDVDEADRMDLPRRLAQNAALAISRTISER